MEWRGRSEEPAADEVDGGQVRGGRMCVILKLTDRYPTGYSDSILGLHVPAAPNGYDIRRRLPYDY